MYTGGPMGMGGKPKSLAEIMFSKFDKDGSGTIDHNEFHLLCFNLGYPITQEELDLAVRQLDADGSGQIDKNEFKDWWRQPNRWKDIKVDDATLEIRRAASDVFKQFDTTNIGMIFRKDFDSFYNHLKQNNLTKKTKENVLDDLDANRDGNIQFKEYTEWLARQGTIRVKVMPKNIPLPPKKN